MHMMKIPCAAIEDAGIIRHALDAVTEDWRGVHTAIALDLPAFTRLSYYASPWWPVSSCVTHPFVTTETTALPEGGMFLLVQTETGFLGLLPLAHRDSYGWFSPTDGRLLLRVGGHGTEAVTGEQPVLAWAASPDPYRVFAEVFRLAGTVIPSMKLREEKPYPEPFRYLGWCSWEEYHLDISSDLLCQTMERIQESPVPVRYLLIDDGHQDFVNPETYFERRLRSFAPDPVKFPRGFAPLLQRRHADGIAWLGLWLPFSAGMCGIDPVENQTGIPLDLLVPNAYGGMLPQDTPQAAQGFIHALLDAAAGFDFVKIDFMSFPIAFFSGASHWNHCLEQPERRPTANPYRQSWRMNRALEALLPQQPLALLNCNAQHPYNLFNHAQSNASRCSGDYVKGHAAEARAHLFQSYANIPWHGQLLWGDHDMFHSCDPLAGRMMAVSKALSGGPVYLSDAPDQFVGELIMPLCYADGRLLRPLAPATPLPESLFLEYPTCAVPVSARGGDAQPYRVIAPLAGGAAAIAAYHLVETETPLSARITPDDYRRRSAMLQPYAGLTPLPDEGLVLWDWYSAHVARLDGDYTFTLENLCDRLIVLLPIHQGWAVGGRFDKYLGPVAVEVMDCTPERLSLVMHESGPLLLWLAAGIPHANGVTFTPRGEHVFIAQLPVGEREYEVMITREECFATG